jgi:alpha-glucosidase
MMKNKTCVLASALLFIVLNSHIANCATNDFEPTPYRGSELPVALSGDFKKAIFIYLPQYADRSALESFPAFSHTFIHEILSAVQLRPFEQSRLEGDHINLIPYFSTPGGRSACRIFFKENSFIYGLGSLGNKLKRNGQSFFMWNTDSFGFEKDTPHNVPRGSGAGKRGYQSHPWLLGVEPDGTSFGIFFATSWRAEITIASNFVDFVSEGLPFPVLIIKGENPQMVLKNFAKVIGTMPLPPLWALGFHQSRWSYNSQAEILLLAKEFQQRQIPCSAIWCDIDYMNGFRTFSFNKEFFPDPAALISELHQYGIRSVWIVDPAIKVDEKYDVYKSGTQEGIWIKDSEQKIFHGKSWAGECVWPDFISRKAREWWKTEVKKFLIGADGIDGLWLDMNEPSVFNSPDGTIPCNALHASENSLKPHTECHNLYACYMAEATFNAMREAAPQKRPFLLTRSGFSGIQKYAASWTGDNLQSFEHLKLSITMCLNAGLSLQPFIGADVGGFTYSEDTNSLALWMAMGAFYPFYRIHTIKGEARREPWSMGKEIEEICVKSINIRYRLLPYLYTQFYKHSQEALPVMRPLFFIAPGDAAAHSIENAFLFGEDILVVPPWEDMEKVLKIASGKAKWHRFYLENLKADNKNFPAIFLREGAIIPILKQAPHSARELRIPFEDKDILLLASPDQEGSAEGMLYEDKGDGFGYLEGEYVLTRFVLEAGEIKGKKITGILSAPYHKNPSFMVIDDDNK